MDPITISQEATHTALAFLNYGTTVVQFDTFNSEVRLKRAATAINKIYGVEVIRFEPTEVIGAWEGIPVHNVIWSDKDNPPPSVTEDEIDLPERILQAKALSYIVQLNISPKLVKYAKKIAAKQGVRIMVNAKGIFANGKPVRVPVQHQIRTAYEGGASFIELDRAEAEISTVRVYASQFNAAIGTKFLVRIVGDKIRIQLKEPTLQEEAVEGFVNCVLRLMSCKMITEAEAQEIVSIAIKPVPDYETALQRIEKHQDKLSPENVTAVGPDSQMFIVDLNTEAEAQEIVSEETEDRYIALEDEIDEDDF